ncbi:unnamed protein product [Bemisia tabaci]|uniref:Ionotropic receptor n=1 Tax=Bemisia tabaci TaxID=7038 RepID=A0A9P0F7J1_BEMTA|nr:unnamed protein product [Bemisia tabaci]
MNGKSVGFYSLTAGDGHPFNTAGDLCTQIGLLYDVIEMMTCRRNGSFREIDLRFDVSADLQNSRNFELGLKYGVAVLGVEVAGIFASLKDDFDVSPAIETCQLSILVPRKGFVPQYFAIFYCFSPTVWIFVWVTFTFLITVHRAFVFIQQKYFLHVNTNEDNNDATPTVMTIYRYILGISQPRLVLIELLTGKIIFFNIVFPTMVLTTLFLSGMVTLLNERIRYHDMNTLDEIKQADLLVQSSDLFDDLMLLADQPFDWIEQKLSDTFLFRCARLDCVFEDDVEKFMKNISLNDEDDETKLARGEVDAILKSDAFLARTPTQLSKYNNELFFDESTGRVYEFHRVEEYIYSYPKVLLMLRNNFYREEINDGIMRYVESGILGSMTDSTRQRVLQNFQHSQEEEIGGKPKPFSMTDLKIAFICLVIDPYDSHMPHTFSNNENPESYELTKCKQSLQTHNLA